MSGLTAVLTALLRRMLGLVPAERRDWCEAVLGEAAGVPAGRARVSWLIGGFGLVISESGLIRRLASTVAGLAAGAALVALDRHQGSTYPAASIERSMRLVEFLLPAVVPWLVRPWFGPVAGSRTARGFRIGGYLGLYALMLMMVGVSRTAGSRFDDGDYSAMTAGQLASWAAEVRGTAVVGGLVVTAVLSGYACIVLGLTSRRWAVQPGTLALGGGVGVVMALFVYALAPLGSPREIAGQRALTVAIVLGIVLVPPGLLVAVGRFAGRRGGRAVRSDHSGPAGEADQAAWEAATREGRIAGLVAGGVGSLVLGVATVATMLMFPHRIPLEWANPDPSAAHGTTYEWQMSLGDSAEKYEVALVLGPLAGLVLGTLGGVGQGGSTNAPVPAGRRARGGPIRQLFSNE